MCKASPFKAEISMTTFRVWVYLPSCLISKDEARIPGGLGLLGFRV